MKRKGFVLLVLLLMLVCTAATASAMQIFVTVVFLLRVFLSDVANGVPVNAQIALIDDGPVRFQDLTVGQK